MKPCISEFLAAHGYEKCPLSRLSADASFRSYYRIRHASGSLLLMDAPPEREKPGEFFTIARHLQGLGLRPPKIYSYDLDQGLFLIEDFGIQTFSSLLDQGADSLNLYRSALDALLHLHRHPRALQIALPEYSREMLLNEAMLLPQWFAPTFISVGNLQEMTASYRQIWNRLLAALPATRAAQQVLVLRDFHVDNLMRVVDKEKVTCGLLDFQDACIGSPAYDLVSLLEDARRDLAPDLVAQIYQEYLAGNPPQCIEEFAISYRLLSVQRHCKVLGIFARLAKRDRKPGYLQHLPRVWRLLAKNLNTPVLRPLGEWFQLHLPELEAKLQSENCNNGI